MIHELRIYHCTPGRMGDVMARFQPMIFPLWERHGIRQKGFWTVMVGPSNLDVYYLLEWDSLAERERIWAAFQSDPDLVTVRAETESDGPLIARISNILLQPTAFSALQ